MISTANYSSLPNKDKLQQISKAVSVMDAILSQEWEYRYYSYQSKWSDSEEFCEMRNGQGDHMLILFRNDGCVINGMTHEYYPKNKGKLTKGLPEIYNEFIFGEPVNSIGTTFCLWTSNDAAWKVGELESPEDGSGEMLQIFDGNPQTYIDWAKNYFEDAFLADKNTFGIVSDIYKGNVLTKDMILSVVDKIDDWEKLKTDLKEINYSFELE
jgi:hypothetical protein